MDFDWTLLFSLYIATFVIQWSIRIGVGLLIIMRRRTPSAALAWLGLVAFFPIPGAILYVLIGENRLGRRDVERYRNIVQQIDRDTTYSSPDQNFIHPEIADNLRPMSDLVMGYDGSFPLGGNRLSLIDETDRFIDLLIQDIAEAKQSCNLLYYIFNADACGVRLVGALCEAAKRGVDVRLMVDAVGSRSFVRSSHWTELQAAGVHTAEALPVNALRVHAARIDLRNHRKLTVIDHQIAYTGSHNISTPIYPKKEAFGAWVDATVRITGPAVIPLQRLFVEDWAMASNEILEIDWTKNDPWSINDSGKDDASDHDIVAQVLPTGPLIAESPMKRAILHALHTARDEIILTTPYFVPDESTVAAMCTAARRGVRVVMVVPKRGDNWITQAAGRSHYGTLLTEGVEIQEYTAGLLHAKTLTVDREFGLIGSANLDIRSFFLNFELAILIYSTDAASELRYLQMNYVQHSERLNTEIWKRRPYRYRLGDNLAKLLSPLL